MPDKESFVLLGTSKCRRYRPASASLVSVSMGRSSPVGALLLGSFQSFRREGDRTFRHL